MARREGLRVLNSSVFAAGCLLMVLTIYIKMRHDVMQVRGWQADDTHGWLAGCAPSHPPAVHTLALIQAARASLLPWSLYRHLRVCLGWQAGHADYGTFEYVLRLELRKRSLTNRAIILFTAAFTSLTTIVLVAIHLAREPTYQVPHTRTTTPPLDPRPPSLCSPSACTARYLPTSLVRHSHSLPRAASSLVVAGPV